MRGENSLTSHVATVTVSVTVNIHIEKWGKKENTYHPPFFSMFQLHLGHGLVV